MTNSSILKQKEQSDLIPLALLEQVIEQLLAHNNREALRAGFVALIEDLYQPKQIQFFMGGPRGLVHHRDQSIAEIVIHDVLNVGSPHIILVEDSILYATVESRASQVVNDSESKLVDVYVPLMQGDMIDAILVVKSFSCEAVNQLVWEQIISAYNHLNRMLYASETDHLTGLMNRQAFDRLLNEIENEEDGSPTAEESVYLGLIDIDFFKKINDNFGHVFGDEILILLARVMHDSFRNMDWLFRYGGEEFAVILRKTSPDDAHRILERLRETIENTDFSQVGPVTVSIGYSQRIKTESITNLIERADRALYYAKEHGRNQLSFYEGLLERGLIEESPHVVDDIELF
ncbi:MAG: GGDEF domain-containing protein [Methylophagaceae bacterium]